MYATYASDENLSAQSTYLSDVSLTNVNVEQKTYCIGNLPGLEMYMQVVVRHAQNLVYRTKALADRQQTIDTKERTNLTSTSASKNRISSRRQT